MVAISARVRPMRSATKPNISPPTADVSSVMVASSPAVVVVEPEVRPELAERHGVEQEVHGVEHPAELGGQQHAPLLAA